MYEVETIISKSGDTFTARRYQEWLEKHQTKDGFKLISVVALGSHLVVTYDISKWEKSIH